MNIQKEIFQKRKLENKVAIVTGATSGIGLEVALLFLEHGAKVIFISNQPTEGKKIIDEILKNKKEEKPNAYFFECDISDYLQLEELMKFDRLDILANIAGIVIPGSILDIKNEVWEKTLKVNCFGTLYAMKLASKIMIEKKIHGTIINTSSILGSIGSPNLIAYCASKGAIEQMTKSAALCLAPFNIRVNAIAPGYIETPMTQILKENESEILNRISLKRAGLPKEVANAFLFLSNNEDSNYITGTILSINGGWNY